MIQDPKHYESHKYKLKQEEGKQDYKKKEEI